MYHMPFAVAHPPRRRRFGVVNVCVRGAPIPKLAIVSRRDIACACPYLGAPHPRIPQFISRSDVLYAHPKAWIHSKARVVSICPEIEFLRLLRSAVVRGAQTHQVGDLNVLLFLDVVL